MQRSHGCDIMIGFTNSRGDEIMNRPEYNRKINMLDRDILRCRRLIDTSQEKLRTANQKRIDLVRKGWDR